MARRSQRGRRSAPSGYGPPAAGGDSDAAFPPQPQDGHWALANPVWVFDTCGFESIERGADLINAGYTSEIVSETSFTLAVDELGTEGRPQQEPYACTLFDDDFSCALHPDFDAVWHFGTLSSGTILSSNSATVAVVWTFACDGADCSMVQAGLGITTLPCASTIAYAATAD